MLPTFDLSSDERQLGRNSLVLTRTQPQLVCQLPQTCAEDVLNTLQDSHTPLALEMRRMLMANYERDNDLTLTVPAVLPNAVPELHQDSSSNRTHGLVSSGRSAMYRPAQRLLEQALEVVASCNAPCVPSTVRKMSVQLRAIGASCEAHVPGAEIYHVIKMLCLFTTLVIILC